MKLIVGGTIIFSAMAILMAFAVTSTAMPDVKVGDLLAQGDSLRGRTVCVVGQVVPGTIERSSNPLMVKFSAKDLDDSEKVIPVVYKDTPPDTFKDDVKVRVQGTIDSQGVLQADKILTQCPSKYEQDYSKLKGKSN